MAKYRILLADGSLQFQTAVRDYFTAQEQIAQVDAVSDGQAALDALRTGHYDVLLERLKGGLVENPPATIVVSAMRHEDMVRQACTLGARYFMVKPVEPDTLYKRMLDMLESTYNHRSQICTMSAQPKTLDEKVTSVFLVIGIPAHIKGYHYLREAVRMVYFEREIINRITKELYPGIA